MSKSASKGLTPRAVMALAKAAGAKKLTRLSITPGDWVLAHSANIQDFAASIQAASARATVTAPTSQPKAAGGLVERALDLETPSSEDVRVARLRAELTQGQAATLVSTARSSPYRTWQGYEAPEGSAGHRTIPLASWALFLMLTGQHPALKVTPK